MSEGKQSQETTIGSQVSLIGQMDTDQPMHIRGIYEGDLSVANVVFVEDCGMSCGNIAAEHVVVHGVVVGSVRAVRVEIRSNGKVWGNVCAHAFYVEPGGFVRGQVIAPTRPGDENWVLELPVKLATLPLQPMREDGLDRLLEELETIAQQTVMPDDVMLRPQPLQIKRALAQVADAKNWMILQLQLEHRALQEALEEREALIALFQDEIEQPENGREASLFQQIVVLENQLQRLRKVDVQRQQSLSRLQIELIETRLSLQTAQDEIAVLREDLNEQGVDQGQTQQDRERAKTARVDTEIKAIVAERDRAVDELAVAQSRIAHLELQLEQVWEEQSTAAKTVAQLQDALEKTQSRRADLAVRLSRAKKTAEREEILTAKAAALRDALETTQRQKAHLEQIVERLTNERNAAREAQKQEMKKLSVALTQGERLTVERDQLRQSIERLQEALKRNRLEKRDLEQIAARLTEERDQIEHRLSERHDELKAISARRAELAEQLVQMKEAASHGERYKAEMAELQAALEASRQKQDTLEKTLQHLESERDATYEDIDRQEAAMAGLQLDLNAALESLEQLIVKRDELRNALTKAERALAEAEREKEALAEQAQRITSERDMARAARERGQASLVELRQELDAASARIQHLASERDALRDEVAQLRETAQTAESRQDELATLREALAAAEGERDNLLGERDNLLSEKEVLVEERDVARERGQASLAELRQELDAASARIQHLASERDALRDEVAQLRETAQTAESRQDELATLREALAAAEGERDNLLGERDRLLSEKEVLVEERDAARERRQASLIELQADLSAALECIETLQSERDGMQEEVIQLKQALGTNEAQRVEMAKQLAHVAASQDQGDTSLADVTALREALAISERERKTLAEQLEQARQADQTWAEERHQRDLHERAAESQAEIERLIWERDHAQAKWDQAQATIAQLNADLKVARRRIVRLNGRLTERDISIQRTADVKKKIVQEPNVHIAYCLRCRAQRLIANAREVKMPNGQQAVKGRCAVCGAGLLSQLSEDHRITQEMLAFLR